MQNAQSFFCDFHNKQINFSDSELHKSVNSLHSSTINCISLSIHSTSMAYCFFADWFGRSTCGPPAASCPSSALIGWGMALTLNCIELYSIALNCFNRLISGTKLHSLLISGILPMNRKVGAACRPLAISCTSGVHRLLGTDEWFVRSTCGLPAASCPP